MNIPIDVNDPDLIFHYTPCKKALEKILPTKKLRFSYFKNTDDPREYKDQWYGFINWPITKLDVNEIHKNLNIVRNQFKLACFCTNNTDDSYKGMGYAKSRMWSQYANHHEGICMAFSTKILEESVKDIMGNAHGVYHDKVNYVEKIQFGNETEINGNELLKQLESQGLKEFAINHMMNYYKFFFLTKVIDYHDESEYRIVVYDPNNKLDYIDISNSIRAIIIGDRVPKDKNQTIKDFCKQLNVPYYKVLWENGNPKLTDRIRYYHDNPIP